MFTNIGVAKSAIVVSALIVGVSIIPTMALQWKGSSWRSYKRANAPLPPTRELEKANDV